MTTKENLGRAHVVLRKARRGREEPCEVAWDCWDRVNDSYFC